MIDLVLAGDNTVIIGLAAAGLPVASRTKVIFGGIAAATVLRIMMAAAATQLLQIVGLTLLGGTLLFLVAWKLWTDLSLLNNNLSDNDSSNIATLGSNGSIARAAVRIVLADVALSLDNVIAVAGASHNSITVLVIGLLVSIGAMGIAASLIADILKRNRWLAYIGLAAILFVAVDMTWRGINDILPYAAHACAAYGVFREICR